MICARRDGDSWWRWEANSRRAWVCEGRMAFVREWVWPGKKHERRPEKGVCAIGHTGGVRCYDTVVVFWTRSQSSHADTRPYVCLSSAHGALGRDVTVRGARPPFKPSRARCTIWIRCPTEECRVVGSAGGEGPDGWWADYGEVGLCRAARAAP